MGLIDDRYNLNTGGKLSLQIIPIFYLIFLDFSLQEIEITVFDLDLGVFSIPFTFLSVLFLINAFNYFDGIDGTLFYNNFDIIYIILLIIKENHYLVLVQVLNF